MSYKIRRKDLKVISEVCTKDIAHETGRDEYLSKMSTLYKKEDNMPH